MIPLKVEILKEKHHFLELVQSFGEAYVVANEYLEEIVVHLFREMAHQHRFQSEFNIVIKIDSKETFRVSTNPYVPHLATHNYYGNVTVSEIWQEVLALASIEVPELKVARSKDPLWMDFFTFRLSLNGDVN